LSIQEKIENARKRKDEERQRLIEQRKSKRSASTQGHFFKPTAMNADLDDLRMQHDSETKVIKTGKQTSKPFFNRRLRNSSQNPPTDTNNDARETRIGRGSVNAPKPSQSQAFNTIDKIQEEGAAIGTNHKKTYPLAPKMPKSYQHGNSRTSIKKSTSKLPIGNSDVTNSTSLSTVGPVKNVAQNEVIVEFDPLTESQKNILLNP
jgi:hypothetical protein